MSEGQPKASLQYADAKKYSAYRSPTNDEWLQEVRQLETELESLKRERAMLVAVLQDASCQTENVWNKWLYRRDAALSATEPQNTQWLAEKKAEAVLSFLLVQMSRDYSKWPNQDAAEYIPEFFHRLHAETDSNFRLAASKCKEQVSPESDIDQLTRRT